jgi:redox-sensitive bicupin YhaK (pirin superfamily)
MRADGGRVHGFQLWVNLPARDKMIEPRYQEIPGAKLPKRTDGGATVRVIAGEGAVIDTRTPILYQHWTLEPGARVIQPVPGDHNAGIYVFGGIARVGPANRAVRDGQLAVLGAGHLAEFAVDANAAGPAQLLLLAGKPLAEPVARWGPFVMNTEAEIHQAIADFRDGRMGTVPR